VPSVDVHVISSCWPNANPRTWGFVSVSLIHVALLATCSIDGATKMVFGVAPSE
jgi:hypothetical protein